MEKTRRGIRLSQCMIVKNEEASLPRALGWAKGLAWEQIVVDTGSTDRTAQLAGELGAKVFTYPWQDDFGAAKNFALRQAQGDWIAFLDADEYLEPDGARKLQALLEQIRGRDFDAVSTAWEQLGEDGNVAAHGTQVRIFRSSPDIFYQGRIHEQLVRKDGQPLKIADVGGQIPIFHIGYQPKEMARKQTAKRNRAILMEEWEKRPGDSAVMGYLGDACYDEEHLEEARSWYERAAARIPEKVSKEDQRSAFTFLRLMQLARRDGREEELFNWYEEGARRFPEEPDFDYLAGLFYAEQEDYPDACRYLGEAFQKLREFGLSNRAMFLGAKSKETAAVYAKCLYRAGRLWEAATVSEKVLQADPWDMSVLSVLLQSICSLAPDEGACLEQVGRAYPLAGPRERLFLYRCACGSGLWKLAGALWDGYLSEEEKQALKSRGMDADRGRK